MKPGLVWKPLTNGGDPEFCRAQEADDETWTLYPRRDSTREIKYSLPFPEGEDVMSVLDRRRRKEFAPDDEEYWYWGAVGLSAQEIGYVGGPIIMAQVLIDHWRNIRPEPRYPDEILLDAYFTKEKTYTDDAISFVRKIGSRGYLTVRVDSQCIHVYYDPKRANRWYNLLRVNLNPWNYSNEFRVPHFYPEGCEPVRDTLRFVVDVMTPWVLNNKDPANKW